MRILLVNIADSHYLGTQSAEALRKVPDTQVDLIQLLAEAKSFIRSPEDTTFDSKKTVDTSLYQKIIIAAHGVKEDTDHCYCNKNPREYELLFRYDQLAAFLNAYFNAGSLSLDDPMNMTLSICYASRTRQYDIDHILFKDTLDFKQCFAYRFLESLNKLWRGIPNVNLSAYTGSIRFNNDTGALEVETEQQIRLQNGEIELKTELAKLAEQPLTLENSSPSFEEIEGIVKQFELLAQQITAC
ncbi:MAG: hypothetical protein JSS53_09475 [Proteobacteria bacterium]|nr:hypothetical protein [Pseudomonadota bacterium]